MTVADPGFPVGGRELPRRLRFENCVCRIKRIWTLRGACAGYAPSRSANAWRYCLNVLSITFKPTCRFWTAMFKRHKIILSLPKDPLIDSYKENDCSFSSQNRCMKLNQWGFLLVIIFYQMEWQMKIVKRSCRNLGYRVQNHIPQSHKY